MIELEYLGRSGDASSIILTDDEGQRYNVAITDDLRTALRRDPLLSDAPGAPDQSPKTLRPAHIQALLREGLSAEEIALTQGVSLEAITRYESPVIAEKAWAISRAQQAPVTSESGAPTLEDLVINRLAARGVDHRSLVWDALRRPGEDWEVSLTFVQSAVEKTATWTLAPATGQVNALDQEAHWLTETASPLSPVSAFFSPVAVPQVPTADDEAVDSQRTQEALVDQANALRGRRQPVLDDLADEPGGDEDFPFFSGRVLHFESRVVEGGLGDSAPSPAPVGSDAPSPRSALQPAANPQWKGTPAAPPATPPTTAPLPASVPGPGGADDDGLFGAQDVATPPAPEKKRTGSKRRPVPSWDEIVFGVRPE